MEDENRMFGMDEFDRRAGALLARLAEEPDDEECARQFDDLYYEIVWRYLRGMPRVLATRVARHLGLAGAVAPTVLDEEVDEVAHDATTTALRRVRQNAAKFDPAKGTPTQWVLGAAQFAYIDVAKAIVGARRSGKLEFVDPLDLLDEPDSNPTTDEHALRHIQDAEALADAARHLSEEEFAALRLRVTAGYSRAEIAAAIFGDPEKKKQVDRLVERGKRQLAQAWSERRPSPRGSERTNLRGRGHEREGER